MTFLPPPPAMLLLQMGKLRQRGLSWLQAPWQCPDPKPGSPHPMLVALPGGGRFLVAGENATAALQGAALGSFPACGGACCAGAVRCCVDRCQTTGTNLTLAPTAPWALPCTHRHPPGLGMEQKGLPSALGEEEEG